MLTTLTTKTSLTLTRLCVLCVGLAVAAGLIAGGPASADAAPHSSAKAGHTKRSAKSKHKSAKKRLRIVGGVYAGTQEFPWAAFIRFTSNGGSYRCTGSVIKPRFVLTAGHCAGDGTHVNSAAGYTVIVGRDNINDTSSGRAVGVSRVIPHPNYYESGLAIGNDIALLELKEPVSQTPATMVAPGYFSSTATAAAVGWGRISDQGPASDDLLGTVFSLFKDDVCQAPGAYGTDFDGDIMLCAGTMDGSRDTCFGDSGGPLMVLDSANTWKLVGVTSFGVPGRCGVPNVPGVYAYLGNAGFQSWIEAVTSANITTPTGGGSAKPVKPVKPVAAKPAPTVPPSCGSARIGKSPLTMYGRAVKVRVHLAPNQHCRATMTLKALRGGRKVVIGRKSVLLRPNAYLSSPSRRVKVHVNAPGRRMLARGGSARVQITITTAGNAQLGSQVTKIQGPKRGSKCCATVR